MIRRLRSALKLRAARKECARHGKHFPTRILEHGDRACLRCGHRWGKP